MNDSTCLIQQRLGEMIAVDGLEQHVSLLLLISLVLFHYSIVITIFNLCNYYDYYYCRSHYFSE